MAQEGDKFDDKKIKPALVRIKDGYEPMPPRNDR
jgi:hypothetical protein